MLEKRARRLARGYNPNLDGRGVLLGKRREVTKKRKIF